MIDSRRLAFSQSVLRGLAKQASLGGLALRGIYSVTDNIEPTMGAVGGAVGGGLGGYWKGSQPDEQGQTHRLRNTLVGLGGGAVLGGATGYGAAHGLDALGRHLIKNPQYKKEFTEALAKQAGLWDSAKWVGSQAWNHPGRTFALGVGALGAGAAINAGYQKYRASQTGFDPNVQRATGAL